MIVRRRLDEVNRTASTAVPDDRRSLSDAILVEASVLGRVLGIRVLRLEASVVLAPARISSHASGHPPLALTAGPTAVRTTATGGTLADAARVLEEGATTLAAARGART